MAFDPAHIDWASGKHHTSGDAQYGDDWGDRSPGVLLRAWATAGERATVDRMVDKRRRDAAEAFELRNRRRAKKRLSAKVEREILREARQEARRLAEAGHLSAFGSALAEALAGDLSLSVAFPARQGACERFSEIPAPRRSASRLRAALGLAGD